MKFTATTIPLLFLALTAHADPICSNPPTGEGECPGKTIDNRSRFVDSICNRQIEPPPADPRNQRENICGYNAVAVVNCTEAPELTVYCATSLLSEPL